MFQQHCWFYKLIYVTLHLFYSLLSSHIALHSFPSKLNHTHLILWFTSLHIPPLFLTFDLVHLNSSTFAINSPSILHSFLPPVFQNVISFSITKYLKTLQNEHYMISEFSRRMKDNARSAHAPADIKFKRSVGFSS